MFEFESEGMSCPSCAGIITRAVKTVDPKAQVKVDIRTQKITVQSDQKREELIQIIEEAGYPVKVG